MTAYDLLTKYSPQLPRYTSYPAAPHFYALDQGLYADWLADLPEDEPLSLYFHVPFCQKLCWFCGCHTHIAHHYSPIRHYLGLLEKELALVSASTPARQVKHIHFGGGSPGILSPSDFRHFTESLARIFTIDNDAEIAIELDPRTVTEAKVAAYSKAGVNRASFGIQDFNQQVQQAIGREQPFHQVYDTIRLCRDYGIANINMDFIYGLPGQTADSIRQTLEQIILFSPERVSYFGYAHVPWKKKNIRLIDDEQLPDGKTRFELFDIITQELRQAGYLPIGMDHFVKANDSMALAARQKTLRRNFQGYSTDACQTLIGIGESSIGSFRQGYIQNETDAKLYEERLSQGMLPVKKGFILSEDDKARRRIIESLMCYAEVDLLQCGGTVLQQSPSFAPLLTQLDSMAKDGLLTRNSYHIRINPELPQAVRVVSSLFDQYLTSEAQKYAQVS